MSELEAIATLAGVVLGMTGTIVSWLWKHSSRLTASEVRIEGLQHQITAQGQDIGARLQSIENKLDRMIERELGNHS